MPLHPPAARRAIIRQLKRGEHPAKLVKEAFLIEDPGHLAGALLALAGDDRLPAKKAAQLVRDATKAIRQVDRPGRMAEILSDSLEAAGELQRGPETDAARRQLVDGCVHLLLEMHNGAWTTDAIIACAPHLPESAFPTVLERALKNTGGEAAACKALLDAEPDLATQVAEQAPPALAAVLLARVTTDKSSAIDVAWSEEDPAKRREALRVLIWQAPDAEALDVFARSCRGRADDDRAAILTMIAGRADRLRIDASAYFGSATAAVGALTGNAASKAQRKLAQTMERAGLDPIAVQPSTPEPTPEPKEEEAVPVKPSRNHVLALVDGYTGGLAAPHLRAVARAAPLCIAFDLDLALVGFPTQDEKQIVALVEAETNVGEDAGYAQKLYDDGRLFCIPLKNGVPAAWPGTPIATTPHPHEGKNVELDGVPGPICLLLGLGKQGLPKRTLNVVDHHHELSGQGISMETATAMGILADRLGRVPK